MSSDADYMFSSLSREYHALSSDLEKLRANRDCWEQVARVLALKLGKEAYADAEYENQTEDASRYGQANMSKDTGDARWV
jgi:hypothetical protein